MKTLYRIENTKDGKGFWRSMDEEENLLIYSHSQYKRLSERHCDMEVFPNFNYDHELNEQVSYKDLQDYKFAFNSLEELLQGVTREEIIEFLQMGYKVYEIQANQVISSKFQSIFKEENIIEKNNISSIFQ